MKKYTVKSLMLLICATLLLTVSVGSTVAYLVAGPDSVTNTFTPASVDTEVDENFPDPKTEKSDIKIQNSGEVSAYVRVMLVGYWCDENGIVDEWTPNFTPADPWFKSSDGFYYYKEALSANDGKIGGKDETSDLLAGTTINGTDPDRPGQWLVVNVLHQSIQAQPSTAVEEAWSVTVADDGTISK